MRAEKSDTAASGARQSGGWRPSVRSRRYDPGDDRLPRRRRIEPVTLEGRHRPARAAVARPRPGPRRGRARPGDLALDDRPAAVGGRPPRRGPPRRSRPATPARSCPFATIEAATGRPIGSSRYLNIVLEHRRLEIGWTWVAPRLAADRRQSRGEAADARATRSRRLGCRRVEFKTDSNNEPSRTALLGIGAAFEGIFRKHMVMPGGGIRHSAWYSVIDEEWPAVRGAARGVLLRALTARSCGGHRQRPGVCRHRATVAQRETHQ